MCLNLLYIEALKWIITHFCDNLEVSLSKMVPPFFVHCLPRSPEKATMKVIMDIFYFQTQQWSRLASFWWLTVSCDLTVGWNINNFTRMLRFILCGKRNFWNCILLLKLQVIDLKSEITKVIIILLIYYTKSII